MKNTKRKTVLRFGKKDAGPKQMVSDEKIDKAKERAADTNAAEIENATTAEQPLMPTENDVAEAAVKKGNRLARFDYFWTILSTVYAIVSTCVFIAKDWVSSTATYVLIGLLAAYIVAFAVILGVTFRKPDKKRAKPLKYYRSLLKIFRGVSNVVFLALSAVSMAAVASGGLDLAKWFAFGFTFFVAVVKLGIALARLTLRIYRKRIGKKYVVEVTKYVNGQRQKKTVAHKYAERTYKNDD